MTTPRSLSTSRGPRACLAAVAVLGLLGGAGCYKPVIDDKGLKCAVQGKKCPDGFTCADDGFCWRKPPGVTSDAGDGKAMSDSSADADADDGKPDSMCALPGVPSCADAPASGQVCNPACQTGCGCGRCNVVGKAAACVSAGAVKLGDICRAGAGDDCAPGLICLKEPCGNGIARCYKHCTKSDQCGGTFCQVAIMDDTMKPTGFTVCDVAPRTCNPVMDSNTSSGCPDPALKCYLTGANDTLCDCPLKPAKPAQNGEECRFYNDCDGGLVCVSVASADGGTMARCHFACSLANPSCPSGVQCVPVGTNAKYGYCDG